MADVQTPNIVPVDLNSILHLNALTLSKWFEQMGNKTEADKYASIAKNLLYSIQEVRILNLLLTSHINKKLYMIKMYSVKVMWRSDKGAWFDWDLLNDKPRDYFFVSNIVPLWTESYNMPKKSVASAVLGYLKDQHVIEPDYSVKFNGKIQFDIYKLNNF